MTRLIVFALVIVTLYLLWRLLLKNRIQGQSSHQRYDTPILPGAAAQPRTLEHQVEREVMDEEDQRRFDDVAQLLFEKAITRKNRTQAEQIQCEFLNKMPAPTQSQIGEFDQGEWSIFWNYKQQSLEYYVSRYGVFYTHVDRHGVEHKTEFK
ncbi:hypothetical protein [Acinetobacter sp. WZC-1]|uniref:hypothetical protein n=1 Tax=Acinetobacter sp. WZC-1 TaxID=3459034 RepID=UPI00403DA5A3